MSRRYTKSQKFTGVYFETLQSGDKSYYITYKDSSGKKQWVKMGLHSQGIREAYCNQKRIEVLNLQRLGEEPPFLANKKRKNLPTLDELANFYFESKQIHNRSIKHDIGRYNNHIKPDFGSIPALEIELESVKKLQVKKAATHSEKTVNHITDLFSTIIQYNIDHDKFDGPNIIKKLTRLSVNNERERYLTKEEISLLINTVKRDPFIYLFCLLALTTGGRKETIRMIQKKDIDTSTWTVTLKNIKENRTYKGFLEGPVTEVLEKILPNLNPNDYVLTGNTKPPTDTKVDRNVQPVLNDLFNQGLEKDDRQNRCVIHTLRHTFASQLAIQGTPIYTIQKLMDHADISQTIRYAKLAPDSGRDAVKDLWI